CGTCGAASDSTVRKPWDGTPTTSTSAPDTASSRSLVARRVSGSVKPDRYDGFSCFSLTAVARSGLRAHSVVGLRPALSAATVVPHDPAPSTVTRIGSQTRAAPYRGALRYFRRVGGVGDHTPGDEPPPPNSRSGLWASGSNT